MKQLIVNADDFGLTPRVTAGILDAMRDGIVTSTSVLACSEPAIRAAKEAGSTLDGRAGAHLQLTDGKPCSDPGTIPSLVTREGRFPRFRSQVAQVNPSEVRREWCAQVAQFLRSGLRPTHIDSHHHVHEREEILSVYCEIARDYGLPARSLSLEMSADLRSRGVRCADLCETGWIGSDLSVEGLITVVERAFHRCGGEGIVELMCHPGYADSSLADRSNYVAGREQELHVLRAQGLADKLEGRGIRLVGMRILSEE